MSSSSNDQGRAFEYACIRTLFNEIVNIRDVQIEENSSYFAAQKAWESINIKMRSTLLISAKASVKTIFELEPLILEDGNDKLEIKLQPDMEGISGDVRDIIIIRRNIHWEIGLSLKHNHFAVKHSRISKGLDFGESWYNKKCSDKYWSDIKPIFEYLEKAKQENKNWNDIPHKQEMIYAPLLKAFIDEIKRANEENGEIPRKMVEYLLGEYDFYKVISIDSHEQTQISTFNIHGTLNKNGKTTKAKRKIPVVSLPTRIISLDFKPKSKTTVEMYLNEGWQFSFRIHNASTKVETSLKFDVQIIGMPTSIITINCYWK